jgi:hypothetical protein
LSNAVVADVRRTPGLKNPETRNFRSRLRVAKCKEQSANGDAPAHSVST